MDKVQNFRTQPDGTRKSVPLSQFIAETQAIRNRLERTQLLTSSDQDSSIRSITDIPMDIHERKMAISDDVVREDSQDDTTQQVQPIDFSRY